MTSPVDAFCDRLRSLRVDRSGGVAKPYKPVLVAAVVVLIHKGKQRDRNVLLDGGLRSAFHQLLGRLFPGAPWKRPKAEYPFRHLENDGVWKLIALEGAAGELQAAKAAHAEAWDVLRHVQCAQLDEAVFEQLAADPKARARVLQTLSAYFPDEQLPRLWELVAEDAFAHGDGGAAPRPHSNVLTERALEEHLETHWGQTPFAHRGVELSRADKYGLAGRQVLTRVNSIDLLGFAPADRCWWVIELKRDLPSDAVVGQVSRYLGWVMETRARYGETAVGAIIAKGSDAKLRYAVKPHARLSLWEFDDQLTVHEVA